MLPKIRIYLNDGNNCSSVCSELRLYMKHFITNYSEPSLGAIEWSILERGLVATAIKMSSQNKNASNEEQAQKRSERHLQEESMVIS